MRLILARHGQDMDNAVGVLNGHRDGELTEFGRMQAADMAVRLRRELESRGEELDLIYASPLRRALETAGVVGSELGVDVLTDVRLMERDFGIFSGRKREDILDFGVEVIKTGVTNFFLDGEGVESFERVCERAESFLSDISLVCGNKLVLVVAHGDLLRMVKVLLGGLSWREGLEMERINNADFVFV